KERHIKVAHVEAGLRSFDNEMPEELNRIETDKLSDLLFITEQSGLDNLEKEGILGKPFLVGNVMIDTLVYALDQIKQSNMINQLGLRPQNYFLCTFHRPSNVDEKDSLSEVVDVLSQLATRLPVLFPLHPRTAGSLEKHKL